MKTNKNDFLDLLSSNIQVVKKDKNTVKEVKQYLSEKYGILGGKIEKIFRSPIKSLEKEDIRIVVLISEQIYNKTGSKELDLNLHFTDVEIREAHLYESNVFKNEMKLPLTLENVFMVGNGAFMTVVSAKIINELLESQLLHYDPELQREMKIVKKGDQVTYVPTLVEKNVNEITNHMVNRTLVPTTLVWNAMLGSAENGEELYYDSKNYTLTINESTKVAIVDGFHRHKASQRALAMDKDVDFNFALLITNYSKSASQQYQAQLAEATPISKNRKQQLKAERYADTIVTRLMQESDLKDKVSIKSNLKTNADQLVSYNVLSDTIEQSFDIKTKRDANKVGDYLVTFFDELIGLYPEDFITDIKKKRQESLLNNNNMFVGYIILASGMYENEISIDKLQDKLQGIDFSYNNNEWIELGILDENKRISDTRNSRKNIIKYFKKLL